ncbi:MAG: deoxyribonuclease IV [Fervidicoccaceae archaeon]
MPCGKIRFGPAGKPIDLHGDLLDAPKFLREIGLNAMEYEAVRGVNISRERAEKLGSLARENDVVLSMHAPYYVNLSALEQEKVESSIKRLVDSLQASSWMGSYVVVFHPGYYLDWGTKEAVARVISALKEVRSRALNVSASNVWLGPETTGKTKQVGSVDDIIKICSEIDRCRPVVDWAHLHARSLGKFPTGYEDVLKVIEALERGLGREAVNPLHTHFSKIEYTRGGEKEHHTLDENFGPDFSIVCRAYREVGIDAIIISESPVLERDALKMKSICEDVCFEK